MKHRDSLSDHPHEMHIVFNHDHGALCSQAQDKRRGSLRLFSCHARRWLVEQQEERLARQDHPQFDPLTLTVRQLADGTCRDVRKPCVFEDRFDNSLFCRRGMKAACSKMQALSHRKIIKQGRNLCLNADFVSRQDVALSASYVGAPK